MFNIIIFILFFSVTYYLKKLHWKQTNWQKSLRIRLDHEIVTETRGRKWLRHHNSETGGENAARPWTWRGYKNTETSRKPCSGPRGVCSPPHASSRRLHSRSCPRRLRYHHGGAIGQSPAAGLGGDPSARPEPGGPAAASAAPGGGRARRERHRRSGGAGGREGLHRHHLQPDAKPNSCCSDQGGPAEPNRERSAGTPRFRSERPVFQADREGSVGGERPDRRRVCGHLWHEVRWVEPRTLHLHLDCRSSTWGGRWLPEQNLEPEVKS